MQTPIIEEVNGLIGNYYDANGINFIDGFSFSQWETVRQIIFYSNNRYLDGNKDGEEDRPFYNIVNYAVNVATRATDFDTKDIQIVADTPEQVDKSFILNHELKQWFKQAKFAKTLNEMTETRARFGGLLVKRVERDTLEIDVVPWKNVITDQVDIANGVIIEKHWLSPIDLYKKRDVWDNTEEAMELVRDKEGEDGRSEDKIVIWEVEGEFEREYITGDENDEGYSLQKHFIAGDTDQDQVLLYSEEIKETAYKYIPWQEEKGRGLGRGVVEEGFEAQVWTNDAKIKERKIMEYAAKILFKTTDPNITEQNLDYLDNGAIIQLKGGDFSQVNTVSNSIPAFGNLIESWQAQFRQASSTPESITGETMPSNTPFRSLAVQNQEARSFFDYRKEEMGIFLEEIINEWVLPYLIKRINKAHILNSSYSTSEIKKLDKAFGLAKANKKLVDMILSGKTVSSEEYEQMVDQFSKKQNILGTSRFLDIPEGYFKDWQGKVTTITTGEQYNKQATLESLVTIMNMMIQDPNIIDSPLFQTAVELSGAGISPLELRNESSTKQDSSGQNATQGAGAGANQPAGARGVAESLQGGGNQVPTRG